MLGPDQKFDRTVVSLKIIAKINEHDKLLFRNRNISIQPPSMLTALQRFINGDKRENTIMGINQLLEDIDGLLQDYSSNESSYKQHIVAYKLYRSIDMSMKGIENLKITYADDQVMMSHLESIIEKSRLLSMQFKRISDNTCAEGLESLNIVDG